jgi:hypothetical protein
VGRIALSAPDPNGKSQEEAPPQNEQAQAPKALEVQPTQEAYMAEMSQTRRYRGGFFVSKR